MQIKTAMTYHFPPVRIVLMKKEISVGEDGGG